VNTHSKLELLEEENLKTLLIFLDLQTEIEIFAADIPTGKTIAIVGSTGSGKSTLVKLILRLYEIQSGSITLDGVELRD